MPFFKSDIHSYHFASRYALFGARLRMYVNSETISRDRSVADQLHQWHSRLVKRHHLMESLKAALQEQG